MKKSIAATNLCNKKILSLLLTLVVITVSFLLTPLKSFGIDPTIIPEDTVEADDNAALGTLQKTLESIQQLIEISAPILIALIFLFFLYNVVKFVSTEDNKEAARSNMLWSIVGIAVFSTVWGAVAFLRNVTGIGIGENANDGTSETVKIPKATF